VRAILESSMGSRSTLSPVTIPEQRIGYKGPGCLGMIGLLGVAILIAVGGALWIAFYVWPLGSPNSLGNSGTEICQAVHHVDGSTTQGPCFNPDNP
jgi:hypothetical protein